MMFNAVTLENYGAFKGTTTFNLRPSNDGSHKPVILFGGMNGAGKTTMFDAIKIVLYGKDSFDKPLSNKEYQSEMSDRIWRNQSTGETVNDAYVELEFEYSDLGKLERYVIKRKWRRKKNRIEEELTVKRNDLMLSNYEKDQWQEFIAGLMPRGITNLILFDGEKIMKLAEDSSHNIYLKDSFNTLLGLDLVEKLAVDLKIYRTRKLAEKQSKNLLKELDQIIETIAKLSQERRELNSEKVHLDTNIKRIEVEIQREEEKIAQEGGSYAKKRESAKGKIAKHQAEIGSINEQMKELASSSLPFAVAPDLCGAVLTRIEEEEKQKSKNQVSEELVAVLHTLKRSLTSKKTASKLKIGQRELEYMKTIFDTNARRIRENYALEYDYAFVLDLSRAQRAIVENSINSALTNDYNRFCQLVENLEKNEKQLQKQQIILQRAPKDDILKPLIERIKDLSNEMGTLVERKKTLEEEIRRLDYQITEEERAQKKLDSQVKDSDKQKRKMDLEEKIQMALLEYSATLKQEKIKELEINIYNSLSRLIRKKGYIGKVVVDPDTLEITLYSSEGNKIQKSRLASGERQIYAVALLWGLAKTSGRPLPFLIDTPLSRLDSEHRHSIVDNFLVSASHQVIILSTDTEVDEKHFTNLRKHIAQAYLLEHNHQESITKATPGYFWGTQEAKA